MNINDNIVYKPEHYLKARQIVKHLTKHTSIICVGGESGTGKSEIVSILSHIFHNPLIVTLDKFYLIHPNLRTGWRKRHLDCIGKQEIDWELVKEFIDNSNKSPIIVEGLYACALCRPAYKVYLDGTYKDTEKFRRERKKEKQTKFRQTILKIEHKQVLKTKENATIII